MEVRGRQRKEKGASRNKEENETKGKKYRHEKREERK